MKTNNESIIEAIIGIILLIIASIIFIITAKTFTKIIREPIKITIQDTVDYDKGYKYGRLDAFAELYVCKGVEEARDYHLNAATMAANLNDISYSKLLEYDCE